MPAAILFVLAACHLPVSTPSAVETPPATDCSSPVPTQALLDTDTPSLDDFTLAPLYQEARQYKYIFPGYSVGVDSSAPWGFEHLGLDMIIAVSGAAVLAPADGVVEDLFTYRNDRNNQWQVTLHMRVNSRVAYHVIFEPRAPSESEVSQQQDAIPLTIGQAVLRGDLLGAMLDLSRGDRSGGEPGLHFDLWVDGEVVCPGPYFEPSALTGMLTLIQAQFAEARLCYP